MQKLPINPFLDFYATPDAMIINPFVFGGGGGGFTLGWALVRLADLAYADSAIITDGVLVYAWDTGSGGATNVINGVSFPANGGAAIYSTGGGNVSTYQSGSVVASSDFLSLINSCQWTNGASPDITVLTGLTIGKTYLIQLILGFWWVGSDNAYTLTLGPYSINTQGMQNNPQSALCQFVASATSVTISTSRISGSFDFFGIQGYQLRQLD